MGVPPAPASVVPVAARRSDRSTVEIRTGSLSAPKHCRHKLLRHVNQTALWTVPFAHGCIHNRLWGHVQRGAHMRRDPASRRGTTSTKERSRGETRRPAAEPSDPVNDAVRTLHELTLRLRRMLGLSALAE
jgi:hypothetical protein